MPLELVSTDRQIGHSHLANMDKELVNRLVPRTCALGQSFQGIRYEAVTAIHALACRHNRVAVR